MLAAVTTLRGGSTPCRDVLGAAVYMAKLHGDSGQGKASYTLISAWETQNPVILR